MSGIAIDSLASCLGSNKLSYDDLGLEFPEWNMQLVKNKTGINYVYQSNKDESVLDLSIKSSKKTLSSIDRKKIDGVIVVTQTAKNKLPSVSCVLQDKLNLNTNIIAFDINLGCSGYVYALSIIYSLINAGLAKKILLVCSDTYTKYFNKENRSCRSLFSDAAASCIISNYKSNLKPIFSFFTDGSGSQDLMESNNLITMKGSQIFFFTVNTIPELFDKIIKDFNFDINKIDHFVFHQASKIVLDKLIVDLDIPLNKFHINYNEVGNTVSASIPILLEKLVKNKTINKNDLIMLVGFGVGLSASACILEW